MLHLTLHAETPLSSRAAGLNLWRALRRNLGREARGVLLLPDELHVLVAGAAGSPRRRVAAICAALRRRDGTRWQMSIRPRAVDRVAPARLAHLPVERGLVAHPLDWELSTWRDAAGLVCAPWVDPGTLVLRPYAVEPSPRARLRRPPWSTVVTAVCTATRLRLEELPASPIGRRMLLQAAAHQGWDHPELVAGVLRLRTDTARRALRAPPSEELGAVLRCLRRPAIRAGKPAPDWGILPPCSWAS